MGEPTADGAHGRVGRLYDAHAPSLYRYAVMLLASREAAEDVIQQVFASLMKPGMAPVDNEVHYLRRAVRNECFSTLRRKRVRGEAAAPLLEPVDPSSGSPDERLAIEAALRELPPEQREVVHLRVFEGMTFQEIADAAAESINTVAARYRYALVRLRRILK